MTLYLDTSVLVCALTPEADTQRIQDWLVSQNAGDLAISEWVSAEFSSALALKLRATQISAEQRAEALAAFSQLKAESLLLLPVSGQDMRVAAHFLDQHHLGLRAGDALHLAICAEHGATLCALDRRMIAAGPALGVRTRLL